MKDKRVFGAFIKGKRINKNYSQKDLAELLYVSESSVSKWERGVSYPDITLITEICRVLDITERELIQSSDDSEYRKMKRESDKYNKIKKTLFWIFNISYLIAIIVCFIVNLAVNHTLSWFFIVLTSILTAYCFFPTVTWIYNKYKILIFIGSSWISLFILFLTCSIYTANYWFMIPTLGVLLGYFLIFYPIIFFKQKDYFDEEKFNNKWFMFSYILGILLLIYALLFVIYLYQPYAIGLALLITSGCMFLPIVYGVLTAFSMRKTMKIISLSLINLFVFVIILSFGRAIYLKTTEDTKIVMIEENVNKINIDLEGYDINIYSSQDNKIVYEETKSITIETKVIDENLTIEVVDNRKFYDLMFNFGSMQIDLYLKEDIINSLNIVGRTGNIKINEDLIFNEVDIENSTGDISFKANVNNNMRIELSTGDIDIHNSYFNGNLLIKVSSGDIEMSNVNGRSLMINIKTGKTILNNVIILNDFNMEGSTGDLIFDHFDADNIYVKLSTGDVKGSLISSKFFIANSKTGSVNVPNTRTGGECKVTTSTGDIYIKYN